MKHNYPTTRKPAIKPNSQKRLLLKQYPIAIIEETWVKYGMYKAGEMLNANPWVIYHLAREYNWQRALPEHLITALNNGCWELTDRYYIKNEEETND